MKIGETDWLVLGTLVIAGVALVFIFIVGLFPELGQLWPSYSGVLWRWFSSALVLLFFLALVLSLLGFVWSQTSGAKNLHQQAFYFVLYLSVLLGSGPIDFSRAA